MNSQNQDTPNNNENIPQTEENKKIFNYEEYNKLTDPNDKRDFLGEMLFKSIRESPHILGKGIELDIVGKITGMIMEIHE